MLVLQVTKVPAEEVLCEKRMVVTTDFAGRILTISPRDSNLFDFPASDVLGLQLHEVIDIFDDWRQRSGEMGPQMLLLAQLVKEQDMPSA